jgi:hypothetical protein
MFTQPLSPPAIFHHVHNKVNRTCERRDAKEGEIDKISGVVFRRVHSKEQKWSDEASNCVNKDELNTWNEVKFD